MSIWWDVEWSRLKSSSLAATRFGLSLVLGSALALGATSDRSTAAEASRDVQLIGLAPLYEALFAVANCPRQVAIDRRRFAHAAALYHLSPSDFAAGGPFAAEIADLTYQYRTRLNDDRDAFCSVNRLGFAIPTGVLVDRGPVVPHPLPFGLGDGH